VIVERGYSLIKASVSIAFGKLANAGQTCVAPDYALMHDRDVNAFVTAYQEAVRSYYPGGASDRPMRQSSARSTTLAFPG
jgi:coniferyl-aldehyde dehydrogenase